MRNIWVWAGKTVFWLSWPVLFIYVYTSKRTRIIISYKGEVLLVKSWLGPGLWKLPGGGLHSGEDAIKGALRELKEETGIQVEPKKLKFLSKHRMSESGLVPTLITYATELSKRPTLHPRKFELVEGRWFQEKELADRSDICKASKELIRAWRQSN